MDFSLTSSQMKEYIARCVNELNKTADNGYRFKILNCAYPEATINLSTKNGSLNYQMIFTNDYVFCKYQPLCLNMQEIYIKYMYELFGDEYLHFIEENMRKKTSEIKHAAYNKYLERMRSADGQLIEYLLFIKSIKNNSLKQ